MDPLNAQDSFPDTDTLKLAQAIMAGDRIALARGITLVESQKQTHRNRADTLVELCLKKPVQSFRVGITGIPGVGKSTFIEALGKKLTAQGKKVAVLAVDPTSSDSQGSILGDKTRMENLSKDPLAFIRPSPTGGSLGGVTRKTRETVVLCEAGGYEVILIETVGVGQSEIAVQQMVDFFLLLMLAGTGDELQAIKRGIVEAADAVVINKADGENIAPAEAARALFAQALGLLRPKDNDWAPQVFTCSALEDRGIVRVWETLEGFERQMRASGRLNATRSAQAKDWLLGYLNESVLHAFYQHPGIKAELPGVLREVAQGQASPYRVARSLLNRYRDETAS